MGPIMYGQFTLLGKRFTAKLTHKCFAFYNAFVKSQRFAREEFFVCLLEKIENISVKKKEEKPP